MAMVVRSNLMAYNANRQLGMNNSAVSKNLEKLSSGFKINRAADDAAGLAVSEKMKAQIKGLEQASLNSQDGISLVQTAEGALTEVHDMLNRMTELATKSANGTIQDDVDREAIQNEVNKLNEEIDRIADSTNFNGIKLLNGNLSGSGATRAVSSMKLDGGIAESEVDATKHKNSLAASTNKAFKATAKVGDYIGLTVSYSENGVDKSVDIQVSVTQDKDGKWQMTGKSGKVYDFAGRNAGTATAASTAEMDAAIAGELKEAGLENKFKITNGYTAGLVFEAKTAGANGPKVTSVAQHEVIDGAAAANQAIKVTDDVTGEDAYKKGKVVAYTGKNAAASVFSVNGKKFVLAADGQDVSALDKDIKVIFGAALADAGDNATEIIKKETGLDVTFDGTDTFSFKAGTSTSGSGGLTLQIGDTGEEFNQVTVSVDNMKSSGIGTNGLDVSSQSSAKDSIQTIKDAINKVSTNRSELGALQNRLEHTINNLDVTAENMTNANSRIRDTDMAKQMMEYTKMNVLTQSAQAMLAQANQNPQSILQLLQ